MGLVGVDGWGWLIDGGLVGGVMSGVIVQMGDAASCYRLLYALKFLRDKTFAVFANISSKCCKIVEKWTPNCDPCSVFTFVLDRNKYGRCFARFKLVTKFSWY